VFSHISIYIKGTKNKENFTLFNINIHMQFDDLYKKLINGYVVEESLFDIAKGVAGAVAKDIAPTASSGIGTLVDQFKKGPNGKVKLEKPISVSKDMEPAQVNALLDRVATLENEVEEDLGFPIVYKNETFYYLSHDDQNLTVTAANGQTRRIPLEGLELDIVPMDQVEDNETAKKVGMGALKLAGKAALGTAKLAGKSALEVANFATDGQLKKGIKFVKGSYQEDAESSPGRVKRSGASCKGSVTKLRKMAKKYGGEKGKMYHWCANMKGGRKKSEGEEDAEKKVSKTRAKCQAKAKRKYDVWPSAYASGYVQKCVNRGGKIK
jgi:hypothetical protein